MIIITRIRDRFSARHINPDNIPDLLEELEETAQPLAGRAAATIRRLQSRNIALEGSLRQLTMTSNDQPQQPEKEQQP